MAAQVPGDSGCGVLGLQTCFAYTNLIQLAV